MVVSVVGKPRWTQPCIPPGSLNRVPASAGVRRESHRCQVAGNTVWSIWHVISCSGVVKFHELLDSCFTFTSYFTIPSSWQLFGVKYVSSVCVDDRKRNSIRRRSPRTQKTAKTRRTKCRRTHHHRIRSLSRSAVSQWCRRMWWRPPVRDLSMINHQYAALVCNDCTVFQNQTATFVFFVITSANVSRLSIFFHWQIPKKTLRVATIAVFHLTLIMLLHYLVKFENSQ